MYDLLQRVPPHDIAGIVVIVFFVGGGVVLAGWKLWLKHQKEERNAELKRDMIAAGMSADEIVRVLEAGTPPGNVRQ